MKNLTVYRKGFVLSLAMVLLTFGYSQAEELSVDHTYDKVITSVIWIVNTDTKSQGSGVLIDKKLRRIVTNHHVAKKNESIMVFFPVRDRNGELIVDRSFYLNDSNRDILTRLGYAIQGHVIAESSENDLAILRLDGIPETAREIEYDSNYPRKNSTVHIFGNPGDLKLWRWTFGRFEKVDKEMLIITADIYKGNSGGPVVNDKGKLIGIATLSNEHTLTGAIPSKKIKDLLNTLKPRHIFSIQNNTGFTVTYYTKWKENDAWKKTVIKSGNAWNHWYTGSLKDIPTDHPQIRFDYIANDKKVTYQTHPYELETYTRRLGPDVPPSREKDAREYHFEYSPQTQILKLQDSEK